MSIMTKVIIVVIVRIVVKTSLRRAISLWGSWDSFRGIPERNETKDNGQLVY